MSNCQLLCNLLLSESSHHHHRCQFGSGAGNRPPQSQSQPDFHTLFTAAHLHANPQTDPNPYSRPIPTPLAVEAYIRGVYGNPQQYSLDCEIRSALDWAAFYGFHINEEDFLKRLPKSDDPDSGFVGSLNGYLGQLPPRSYGVHAEPIASVLRSFGVNAQAVKGFSWDDLKKEILANRPVITWVVNYPYTIESRQYTASNGHTTTVARFEHTWIITGYNSWSVRVVDSEYTYQMDINDFLSRWAALGNMVVVMR